MPRSEIGAVGIVFANDAVTKYTISMWYLIYEFIEPVICTYFRKHNEVFDDVATINSAVSLFSPSAIILDFNYILYLERICKQRIILKKELYAKKKK